MTQFLTTRELAAMLRVKERKIYDLASEGALPVRRVTGKLLFPRDEIEQWLLSRGGAGDEPARKELGPAADSSAIIAGGHDPLLEWALRESRSGIAAFLDGALDGLRRSGDGCIAAGLHIPESEGRAWNVGAVREKFAGQPVVLIEWAKRTRGLIFQPEEGPLTSLAAARKLRFQARQAEAGSELVLDLLLEREGLKRSDLNFIETVERSETDLATAIGAGRADVGLGIEAAARPFRLAFTPLIVERFDLLVWRRAYFDPPFQKLIRFCSSDAFRRRAEELGGYDIGAYGAVHFNGP
ncbi:DNA binding domain protein, excisionase family [Methylocella silvestris BL2]|uniref:DNA binding domain protein, excisionase family n=1 Tax=Methylocella silvestris (strain DSM 15510 / CIP 108128 / LMG 27833 / NCIMB 13906 / BL2) TaxID=395965 RepID=B8EQP1_METSB|nr:helix-turn-helix transcriptional regulator [Methylocella silvestris]ACK49312.1 DNA binding domain protein, excisionase family [Methylocella silvestris BL2]